MQTWFDRLITMLKDRLATYPFMSYYVGVSGGRDSVFLFHLLKQVIPADQLVVLHLNHGLRGIFSDQDQAFVENLAKRNSIACISERVKIETLPSNGGLENVARQARYHWFKEKMVKKESLLFCGHSLDDHLETMLMKIHRGSGLAGIKGIVYMQEIFGISVCRPLLAVERHQITQYLVEYNIPWCDDHTNLSLEYFRNKIRINTLPQLKNHTKKSLLKISVLANHLHTSFQIPNGIKVYNGLEFSIEEISNLSNFEFRYLIEKIYQYFKLPSGPSQKHMKRLSDFFLQSSNHIELPNFIHVYRWQSLVCFKNEVEPLQNDLVSYVSYDDNVENNKNDPLVFYLPEKMMSQVDWHFASRTEDLWQGKPLGKAMKNKKIAPWRKSCILKCVWQDKPIFFSNFGIAENYHQLESDGENMVRVKVFGKKIKL